MTDPADGISKPTRYKLGTTRELSVEDARNAARQRLGEISSGRNVQTERREKQGGPLLSDLWDTYLELHAKPRKKSWQDDERMYRKYIANMHDRRLAALTQAVIANWHGALAKSHGPVQANRCKALLATMFSKASKAAGYGGPNPVIGIANFPERSRERFLLPAEMATFFTALAKEDSYYQAFFLLCLFTGCRRGNVASMEWSEVDLLNGVWHLPATKTKNKRPASIALCEPATAILRARFENRTSAKWVFPAWRGQGHLTDPKKSWDRVLVGMRCCEKCGQQVGQGELIDKNAWRRADKKYRCPHCKADLPEAPALDLRIHDLRRTQGSWQAALGISLAIIGKSLGHADLKSTQVYARLQLGPVKDAVGRAGNAMLDAAGVTIGSDGALTVDAKVEEGSGDE